MADACVPNRFFFVRYRAMQSAFLLGNLSPNLNSANILAACLLKNVVLATGLKSPEVSRVSAMVGRSISISLQQLKFMASACVSNIIDVDRIVSGGSPRPLPT